MTRHSHPSFRFSSRNCLGMCSLLLEDRDSHLQIVLLLERGEVKEGTDNSTLEEGTKELDPCPSTRCVLLAAEEEEEMSSSGEKTIDAETHREPRASAMDGSALDRTKTSESEKICRRSETWNAQEGTLLPWGAIRSIRLKLKSAINQPKLLNNFANMPERKTFWGRWASVRVSHLKIKDHMDHDDKTILFNYIMMISYSDHVSKKKSGFNRVMS